MRIPGIFSKSAKQYFLGLVFLFSHLYAYSQACNCPPISTCGACSGDYSEFTFRYNGFPAIRVDATDASGTRYTNIIVPTGTIFTFQGNPGNGKFVGQVKLWVNTFEHVTFESFCSFGLIVGNDYGSFTLMAAKSKLGGPLCCQAADLDTTDPIISGCPGNISVFANATCSTPVSWTAPTATDNCGAVTLSSTHAPGSNFPKGVTPVQYTATDDFGNTSTCFFNVTVVDNTNPVISGCPSNIVVNANASCQATVNWTAPTASDNCGAVTLTTTKNPGTIFSLGTTTVIYTATDAAGRTSTCSFNVVVQDNINPVIAGCPTNITVNANASCQAAVNWTAPTVSDNCGAALTSTSNPGTIFNLGTTLVTYTATDAAGNTATCSFNVTVQDITNPVIAGCPSNITVNANASCQATVNWTAPTVSDNCGASLTATQSPGTIFNLGTTLVTYTATDAAGNASTCSFNVTVQDNANPVITGCPSNITVSANASCQATVNWTAPTVSDNCVGTLTLTATKNPGTIFNLGTTPVTYTATDAAGNTSTCSFNVIVQDNTNPVIAGCPSNITVNANATCQATVNWTSPTVSDNCIGALTLTTTKNPGTIFNIGTTIVTYTATDAAGNTSTCSFNVIVQDNTNPVIAGCPSNITVNANASCQATVNWTAPTVSDNCGGTLTLTTTKNPGTIFNVGTTIVTYTATDAAGNTSTCSFNVIVQDITNPVIVGCPSNITVNANASCQATVNWTAPTVSDNCGGTLTLTSTKSPGTIFNLGTTVVTYTAADAVGNTSTCSFNVLVEDNTSPVIAGCPSNITIGANGSCQAVVNWTAPTASDNCTGVTLTTTKNPGTVFNLGTTPVTYTATDADGNTSTCSFNVTVQDNTSPVIAGCPSNITVNANAACQATVNWTVPTVTDNCGGTLTLTSTKNPGTLFNLGTTPVTYTATDAAGNTSTCSFNVIVLDNTSPVIAGCPANITVNANAACQATVSWTAPTVSDNCAGTPTLTTSKSPGTVFGLGTTVVTYTATDAAGNTSTCSFNVTVMDNTNPVITGCPSNITVNANASCQATVNWTIPTVSDNCGGALTLTSTKNPGTLFNLGTTPVTYTATDAAGNTSICSFNVIVQDNTAPLIAGCPANITINAGASCQATVNWTAPTVSDNCSGTLTLTSNKNPGTVFGVGTTVVTYTATDAVGNTSTCSFNVIVQDNTNPVIAGCPSNITVNASASCQATVNWTAPTVSDNCGGTLTLTPTKNPGTIFNVGTTVVTYTATDASGNSSTCSFNVTVQDNSNPVITGCATNITVNANASCQAIVNWTLPTVSDNCAGATLTSSKSPGTLFNLGTTLVTYTATDAAGNTSTCSFNVTVQDNAGPTIIGCPSNITVSANAACQATVNWTAPTASDCGGAVTLATTQNPGTVFSLGSTLVTYTATDVAGNTSTCSFTVLVQDDMPPQFSGCADIIVSSGESCQANVTWVAPVASDCGPVTVTSSHNSGSVFPVGTTQVTYTAMDIDGHTSTCSFNVIVEDKTPPLFASCPSNIIAKAKNSCDATVSWTEPSAVDNCLGVTITKSHSPGAVFPAGTTVVKYTATDAHGNQTVCQFNVTVNVEDLPVISNCPGNIQVNSDESGDAVVEWTVPTATAACGAVTLTSSHKPGDIFSIGTTTVEYKAEDPFGNVAYCRFQVEVKQQEIEIDISQIVTPDGNTQNDEWIVANIENFADNKVVIVDRWGGVIYTASGYNNGSVVWKGYNRNGDLVPTGTYFYTISVRYGPSVFEKTGFIELIR